MNGTLAKLVERLVVLVWEADSLNFTEIETLDLGEFIFIIHDGDGLNPSRRPRALVLTRFGLKRCFADSLRYASQSVTLT